MDKTDKRQSTAYFTRMRERLSDTPTNYNRAREMGLVRQEIGRVGEWLKPTVLKTVKPKASGVRIPPLP